MSTAKQFKADVADPLRQGHDLGRGAESLGDVVGPSDGIAPSGDGGGEDSRITVRASEPDGLVGKLQASRVSAHERQRNRQPSQHQRPQRDVVVQHRGGLLEEHDLALVHQRHLETGEPRCEPEGSAGQQLPPVVPARQRRRLTERRRGAFVVSGPQPRVARRQQCFRPPPIAIDAGRCDVEGPLAQRQRLWPRQSGQRLEGGGDGESSGPDVVGFETGASGVVGEHAGGRGATPVEGVERPPVHLRPLASAEDLVTGGAHEVVRERPAVGPVVDGLGQTRQRRFVEGGDDDVVGFAAHDDEVSHVECRSEHRGDGQYAVGHR